MGHIGLDELSNEMIEYLNTLGLSESQIEELINKKFDTSKLQTNSKDMIGAINELFQNVDSGKELIADAIDDESITKDSTFEAMSEVIEKIQTDREEDRQKLLDLLVESGMDVSGDESINTLLELLNVSDLDLSKIVQVACGGYHTLVVKSDGTLWSCGRNNYGQLGLGDSNTRLVLTQVTSNVNNDVKEAYCGEEVSYIIKNDGTLWACGYNGSGALGQNDTTSRNVFTQVTININAGEIKQFACGNSHMAVVKTDGSLWTCGSVSSGGIGHYVSGNASATSRKLQLTQVTSGVNNDIEQVACTGSGIIVLKTDGKIWACGDNSSGQLGWTSTSKYNTLININTSPGNVKKIYASYYASYILTNDGHLYGSGSNSYGSLGLNNTSSSYKNGFTEISTNVSDVAQISGGVQFMYMLKNDGTLWACGHNGYGQLGINASDTNYHSKFEQVAPNITGIKQVICGFYHVFILKEDGTIAACGRNDYGQLGLDSTSNQLFFLAINETEALKTKIQSLNAEIAMNKGALYNTLSNKGLAVTTDMTINELINIVNESSFRKILYLYKEGVEYPDITGEWNLDPSVSSSYGSVVFSKNDNNLYVEAPSGNDLGKTSMGSFVTTNLIDITDYNTLCFDTVCSINGSQAYNRIWFEVKQANGTIIAAKSYKSITNERHIERIDVSEINENVLIQFGVNADPTASNPRHYNQVYNIWLED